MNKIIVIIQARMGSTRFPGKMLSCLSGHTVLRHVIDRVKQSKEIDGIIVATSELEIDDKIEMECIKYNIPVFRGSEEDVLDRYYFAAKANSADIIIRITGDCPLIDPKLIDNTVKEFCINDYEFLTTDGVKEEENTFPRGLDVEIFGYKLLEKAYVNAKKDYQREHVTPYMYEECKDICYFKNDKDEHMYRWTLDTFEDFEMIKEIYIGLYKGKHNFYKDEVIDFLEKNPWITDINKFIKQKNIK